MMEDFNAMNSSIESGLTRTEGKADTAISTANEAKQTADAAQQVASIASTKADVLPYVVGYYTGTGSDMTIELGFRPSFVIISGANTTYSVGSTELGHYNLISGGNSLSRCITFTDTGFTVNKLEDTEFPKMLSGKRYDYIAFR